MIVRFAARDSDAGRRLSNVLRRDMGLSASLIGRLKFCGGITVNGVWRNTDYLLAPGDVVEADPHRAEDGEGFVPESGPLEILYENAGILAVNKPCGMLVHPSSSRWTGTLAARAAGYLASRGEAPVCHAVNRLDRDTSGAVLFAKDSRFTTLCIRALHEAGAVKEYTALVCGAPEPASGVFDWPLSRVPDEGSMRREVQPGGQSAVTRYETLRTGALGGGTVSVLRLRLDTGRTHQIRVHCAHAGIPLLGDALYGTEDSLALSERLGVSAQALHAGRLSFRDPLGGGTLDLRAPLRRSDLSALLEKL